jgi:hypothetical protein
MGGEIVKLFLCKPLTLVCSCKGIRAL